MINKSDSRFAVVQFCNHSYDYRPNWTPLSSITIINCIQLSSITVINGLENFKLMINLDARTAKLVLSFVTSAKISGPKRSIKINKHFTCISANVIFCITCTPYKRYHIGETERRLGDRFREHLRDVKAMTKSHSNINSNTKFPSIP